jgi:hypothetical protein
VQNIENGSKTLVINALCQTSGGGILSLALPISSLSLMARSGFRLIEPMILNIQQTSGSSHHYFLAAPAHEPS